jgi:hypothetical protein
VPDVRARRWLDVDGDGNIDIKELRIAYEVMPAEMAEVSQGTSCGLLGGVVSSSEASTFLVFAHSTCSH